jgi:hypothetical protein
MEAVCSSHTLKHVTTAQHRNIKEDHYQVNNQYENLTIINEGQNQRQMQNHEESVYNRCGNTYTTAQILPLFSPLPFLAALLPLVSDPCTKSDRNYFSATHHVRITNIWKYCSCPSIQPYTTSINTI